MSSILIKRTLGVAGVTGGLLLVGAGVSLADDGSATDAFGLSQGSGEAAVSAPITLGGISLGVATESTQSSGSTTTTTTDEGTATSTREDASQTSSTSASTSARSPSTRPRSCPAPPRRSRPRATTRRPAPPRRRVRRRSPRPCRSTACRSPAARRRRTASAHESTVTDDEGASVTEGATSTSTSTTTGTLGLGETTLDPVAVLDGSAWSAGSTSDEGDDAATGTSGATGDVGLSSPVNLGGLTAGVTDERSSADEAWTMRTDDDGDAVWTRTESADASATAAGLTTGELTADPAAWLSGTTAQALGTDDESVAGAAATSGDLGVAAPVTFGGADAWLTDERSSWTSTTQASARTTSPGSRPRSEPTRPTPAARWVSASCPCSPS